MGKKLFDDSERAIGLFEKVGKQFFKSESTNAWDMYAPIPEDQPTKKSLKGAQKACKESIKKLVGVLSKKEQKQLNAKLDAYPAKWDKMVLPDFVKAADPGLGMECEVLQEIEVETQVEQQAQMFDNLEFRVPKKWQENLDLFKDDWVKPSKQHIAIKTVAKGIRKITQFIYKDISPLKIAGMIAYFSFSVGVLGFCLGTMVKAAAIASLTFPIITAFAIVVTAAGLLVISSPLIMNKINQGTMMHRVKDVLRFHLPNKIAGAAQFFSPNFLVSENFYVQAIPSHADSEQKPFSIEQKPLFELVVIQDEDEHGAKKLQAMAIDQNDSVYFHRKLKEDRKKEEDVKDRKRKIALYDIHHGMITVQGKNEFDKGELEKSKMFQELLANAKFLNGEIHYTEAELKLLESKAKRTGLGVVGDLFSNHILPNRVINQACFKYKEIAKRLGINDIDPVRT